MKNTATVKIFLVFGEPGSLRTAEISNWTGKAIAGPRSQLDEILQRDEAGKPGVYFLSGVNPNTGKERVYIGEAEVIRTRIKGHIDKDFWKTVTFFVTKDENLTKAHIKYLEGELINRTRKAARYELENANSSGSHLPEADSADMDVFLEKMEQLLPILGLGFLSKYYNHEDTKKRTDFLSSEMKGCMAKGQQTNNGFIVFKDSEAVLEERPSTKNFPYAATLRRNLIEEGILEKRGDKYVFVKDHEFSSPSAAAAVIHGGSANGLLAWKDRNGISLKEREMKEVEQVVGGNPLTGARLE